jgi:transcriptional regulator with PAS, ATPase and Fis domain
MRDVFATTCIIELTSFRLMCLCFETQTPALDSTGEEPLVDLKTAEQFYIRPVMDAHSNDKDTVAKVLGISLRSLYRKLELQDDEEAAIQQP